MPSPTALKDEHELELLIASRFPIIAIETHIVMAERIAALRAWAADRTVNAD